MSLDPEDRDGLYFGSQRLHYSSDRGRSWETLSGDLTTNDPAKLEQATSGGLTIDATKAENHCTVLSIAPVGERPNEIWVGTDDGRLQHTKDRGQTWTDHSGQLKGLPKGSWIPQIHVSAHNPEEVYVVANNYRRNDWAPYLYRTSDGGKSWKRLVYGEDIPAHALCVVQDPEASDLSFLGTEEGLYFSVDRGVNWRHWSHEVPTVPVRDMAIQAREGDLVLGTFGRGAYVIEDLAPLRALAQNGAMRTSRPVLPLPHMICHESASRWPGPRHLVTCRRIKGQERRLQHGGPASCQRTTSRQCFHDVRLSPKRHR